MRYIKNKVTTLVITDWITDTETGLDWAVYNQKKNLDWHEVMEYAKSLAITKGQNYRVVFDTSSESYQIEDQSGATIWHPVKKAPFYYRIDLQAEGLDKVDITTADFSGAQQVEFDYLGSPDSGGAVSIEGGGTTATISVEAVTGFITVTN